MCKVAFVKESRQKGYVVIGLLADGVQKSYTLSKTVYSEIGSPIRHQMLEADTLVRVEKEDECFCALKRALSLLSYADNSERTLTVKLLRAGFSRDAVAFAVRDCVAHGYINEKEQLCRLVKNIANVKLRGPLYIRRYLLAKGYSLHEIDGVISELADIGEIDFSDSFSRLAEKMGVCNSDERKSLAFKYGFKGDF